MIHNKKGTVLVSLLLMAAILSAFCSGCGQQGGQDQAGKNVTLTVGVTPWTSTLAPTHIVKNLLEDMGYTVKLQDAEVGVCYSGLSTGDIDFFMDSWLGESALHQPYMDSYGANIEKVAMSYDKGELGWVVPTYLTDINSIADLKGNEERFDKQLIGIDPGAGMMATSKEIVKAYDLDLKIVEGNEAVMMTQVKRSYPNKQPILFLGWRPHSMFAQYDLKLLEDPKGFWKGSEVWVLANKDLKNKAPEAYEILKRWKIDVEDLEEIIYQYEQGKDIDVAAREWIDSNQEQVNQFLGK